MPFDRPTLEALISQADAEIISRLPGTDPMLRRTLLGILARMEAGTVHGLYGYLAWLAKQLMPDTAEAEHLDRWATIWGVQRKSPSQAAGQATLTGTNGSVIPGGTALRRADGQEYTVQAEVVIAAGTAVVDLVAVATGSSGNTAAGSALTLAAPVVGVNAAATVGGLGLFGGADTEADGALLTRLLERIQRPPHGGSADDYVTWALQISGVTRAWCYPQELGLGTVTVRVMTDDTTVDGIPSAEDVARVQAHIDALRPVTADVTVAGPVAAPLNPVIKLSPNTSAVRLAVEAELRDVQRREAEPGGTAVVSHLREAISIASGEADHQLVSPAADVPHTTGQIWTLGTITWEDL